MSEKKYLFSFLFSFLLGFSAIESGWVQVEKQEKVIQELEEEDYSVWVVFAKVFDSERILIRFPEAPLVSRRDGVFQATASHLGIGEMSLVAQKKDMPSSKPFTKVKDLVYRDSETALLVRERRIETESHFYILRFLHPSESAVLFQTFAGSFEIEREEDFFRV